LVPHNESDCTIDLDILKIILREFVSRGHPVLLILLVGSTLECSIDNVEEACKILRETPGYNQNKAWVHLDAAFGGPYFRFLQIAADQEVHSPLLSTVPRFAFDFSLPEVRSISTSIHKWIPSPFPSSILVISDKEYLPTKQNEVYITGKDYTFGTSRNGHSAIFTWDYLQRKSLVDHLDDAVSALERANELY
jgi:glutamate/tyrosine decarboxylase-like PLP-dependent enzyme